MAEFTVHRVTKLELSPIREHKDFCSRTLIITDEKGETHEVTVFSRSEDEDTLKVLS
jgi:hypothetical protein